MGSVIKPDWKIFYEGEDLSGWINPALKSVEYTDYLKDQTDELTITLEESRQLWKNDWYPKKRDKFSLKIGYEGQHLRDFGVFELDEIEFSGSPDTVSLKALAADISKSLRQENTVAYENMTLGQIAAEIAKKHELEISGEPKNIKVQRITQNQEKDLAFLSRLANQYGFAFKIYRNKLVFTDLEKLYEQVEAVIINKNQVSSYSFRDLTKDTYQAVQVSYFDAGSKKTITAKAEGVSETAKKDVLKIIERCENKEQAQAKADAALKRQNYQQIEGSFALPGNNILIAGINIQAKGFGKLDGKYSVQTARHRFDADSGYTTNLEFINV